MADRNAPLPRLPAHIEETIRSIAQLHARHHQNATPLQRVVDRTTDLLGRPRSIGVLTIIAAGWIRRNLLAGALGAVDLERAEEGEPLLADPIHSVRPE